jgi:prepilin-type N-terminal cleavage/methylation domain-containing protein
MKKQVCSNSGFTIIEVLAALIIVTIAFAGLYTSIIYADYRAQLNYHKRQALLIASGELDEYKYRKTIINNPSLPGSKTITLDPELEPSPLTANITFLPVSSQQDLQVGIGVIYDIVQVQVSWKEQQSNLNPFHSTKIQKVILREDYYKGE